jgi:hypothetical protein
MKIRTPKCRDDRDAAVIVLLVSIVSLVGCHSLAWVGADVRNHPLAMVGDWTDSLKATPTDTSVWRLGPSGQDESYHMVRDDTSAHFRATPARRYGYWYLQGTLGDTTSQAICFTNRPGRSAATCIAFRLDSTTAGAPSRRRLVLRGYKGQHHTADRVLLERNP